MSTVIPQTGSIAVAGWSVMGVLGAGSADIRPYSREYTHEPRRAGRTIHRWTPPSSPPLAPRSWPNAPASTRSSTAAIEAPGQMTYGSQAAAASQVFAQQRDLALRDKAAKELELVDAALARIEAGTFGRCLRCGEADRAGPARGAPWAAYCITCQKLVADGR